MSKQIFDAIFTKGLLCNLSEESTLNTWLRKEGVGNKGNSDPKMIDLSDELKQLRKENARLREEREILKKAATFFAKESK